MCKARTCRRVSSAIRLDSGCSSKVEYMLLKLVMKRSWVHILQGGGAFLILLFFQLSSLNQDHQRGDVKAFF